MSRDTPFIQRGLQRIALITSTLLCPLVNADALTLPEALQLALQQNPSIDAIHAQHRSMEARIDSAAALPDPQIKFTYFGESVETRTGPQQAIYSLQQTIPWLAKLSTQKNIARIDAEIIRHVAESTEQSLIHNVSVHYAEACYQQKALQLSEQSLGWIERAQEIAEQNVRNGSSLNDLLQFEVELERALDRRDQYQQRLSTERSKLAALLGVEASKLGPLETLPRPSTETLNEAELKRRLRYKNPELIAMQRATHSGIEFTQLNKLKRYPDFTFGVNYIQVGDGNSNFSDAGADPWNVSVAMSLPIWQTKNSARIRSALASERASAANYQHRLLELTSALNNAMIRRTDNIQRMQRYETRLIPLAEQALENTQIAYENSQVDVLAVIESERTLLDLQISHWRALADTTQANAEIQALTYNLSK